MLTTAILVLIFARLRFGKKKMIYILDGMIYKFVARMPTWLFKAIIYIQFNLITKKSINFDNQKEIDWKMINSFRKRYAHHVSLKEKVIHLGKSALGYNYVLHCGPKPHYAKWDTYDLMDVIHFRKKLRESFTPEILEFSVPPLSSLRYRLILPAMP